MTDWIDCNFVYKSKNFYDLLDEERDKLLSIYKPIFKKLEFDKFRMSQDELENIAFHKMKSDINPNLDDINNKIDEINNWLVTQDIYSEFLVKFNELENIAACLCDDFYHSQLNRSGILIQLESGKILLIGDINKAGGVCDDCPGINEDDKIVKYKILYEKQD